MSASKQIVKMKKVLERKGHEVFVPKNAEKYASGKLAMENNRESTEHKIEHNLIKKYYSLIEKSDAVIVTNYDKGSVKNYVGGNSFLEAGFAHALNKKLYFMNDIPDMTYSDELRALRPVVLKGDLSKIE